MTGLIHFHGLCWLLCPVIIRYCVCSNRVFQLDQAVLLCHSVNILSRQDPCRACVPRGSCLLVWPIIWPYYIVLSYIEFHIVFSIHIFLFFLPHSILFNQYVLIIFLAAFSQWIHSTRKCKKTIPHTHKEDIKKRACLNCEVFYNCPCLWSDEGKPV